MKKEMHLKKTKNLLKEIILPNCGLSFLDRINRLEKILYNYAKVEYKLPKETLDSLDFFWKRFFHAKNSFFATLVGIH